MYTNLCRDHEELVIPEISSLSPQILAHRMSCCIVFSTTIFLHEAQIMTFVTIKSSSFQIQNLYFNKATVTDIENPVKLLYSSFFQGSEFDYLQPYFYKKKCYQSH